MGAPIIPKNDADPTGQDSRERKAIADFARRMKLIQRGMLAILAKQQYQVVTVNATEYRFELDPFILRNINAEIAALIDSILLEGGEENLWFMNAYVAPAVVQGTAQSYHNLSVQSEVYAASRPTLESVLLSDPYRRRLGLVRAREFELMKGFSEQMRADLGDTLTRGMAAGQNPRVIAKDIVERVGVSQSRAERIARTEINNGLRQAKIAEDQDAVDQLGIQQKQMHISALSPSTRDTHAARNGKLFTIQEQKEWWAQTPNSINCKCTTVAILVNDDGEPLSPKTVERVRAKGKGR
ncbi:Phage Mu protein F like protein [compost metagenome]